MTVVDYSWSQPSIAQLKAAGITEVGRYVGPPQWGKTITQGEYDALVAAGIGVFLVFEAGANDAAGGANAGTANGHIALRYTPIGYFNPIWVACDENIPPPFTDALRYIQGFGAVVGAPKTGVYGEGALIVAAHDAGYALAGGWQSASTSFAGNATTTPDTSIQQGLGGPLPGTDVDTIVRPLIPVPISPAIPMEALMAAYPTGCTDEAATKAQMHDWWNQYHTDPLTDNMLGLLWYLHTIPVTQTAWGAPGYGGSAQACLTAIVAAAVKTSTLRPERAGAV